MPKTKSLIRFGAHIVILSASLFGTLLSSIATAAERPDFTGAWTTYRGNPGAAGGPSRFMGAELKLTPQAEKARQDRYL